MNEEQVTVGISILQAAGSLGWGETKMELLDAAHSDISDALAILESLPETPDTHGIGNYRLSAEERLLRLVVERLQRARARVDICNNELDFEREGIQPVTRD